MTNRPRITLAVAIIVVAVLQFIGSPILTARPNRAANPNAKYTVYVRYPGADSPAKPVAQRLLAELKKLGFDARENVGSPAILWDEVRVDHAVGHRPMGEKIRDVVRRVLTDTDYQTKTILVRQDDDRKSRIIWVLF